MSRALTCAVAALALALAMGGAARAADPAELARAAEAYRAQLKADPALLAEDVAEGYVSPEAAARDYGARLDAQGKPL